MHISNEIKRKAANNVLDNLRLELVDLIKSHLTRSYGISFTSDDDSQFSLEQLHFGLSLMLGEEMANGILNDITAEMHDLLQIQLH